MYDWGKILASFGRNGDTILAHINPTEAMLLKALGGSGTVNPQTGLLEFFDESGGFGSAGSSIGGVGGFGGGDVGSITGGSDNAGGFGGGSVGGSGVGTGTDALGAASMQAMSDGGAAPNTGITGSAANGIGLGTSVGAASTGASSGWGNQQSLGLLGSILGLTQPISSSVFGPAFGLVKGAVSSAMSGKPATADQVMGPLAMTNPVTGLGYLGVQGLEALGAHPTGPGVGGSLSQTNSTDNTLDLTQPTAPPATATPATATPTPPATTAIAPATPTSPASSPIAGLQQLGGIAPYLADMYARLGISI